MEPTTREEMQRRLGVDLTGVRVHTGARAAASARAVDALAYTVGRSIVFDEGRYAPHEPEGRALLGHELVHTIQQGGGRASPGGEPLTIDDPDSAGEREARAIAAGLADPPGRAATAAVARSGLLVARQKPDAGKGGPAPKRELVTAMDVNLTSRRVVLTLQSGGTIGGSIDTDLEAGTYTLEPDLDRHKWTILGTTGGLRFDLELDAGSDGSDGPDPWALAYPKRLLLRVAAGSKADVPMSDVLGDEEDLVSIDGDPAQHGNYVERAIKSVGIPILGGPYYLYHKAGAMLTNPDAVVLQRSAVSLDGDPLAGAAIAIRKVYKTRAGADAAVAAFAVPGTYTYYVGLGGHIFPTVISDTSAPALCASLRIAVDDEKKYARAAARLSIDLALWYVGARFGMKAPAEAAPAEAAEAASAAKQAQALAAEAAKDGKVVVNLGGTGEVANAINVNPLTAQQVKDVPNLVKAGAEELGSLFKPGTVDKIVSNNVVRGTVDWGRAARGSFDVLKSGGQVSIAPYAGDLAAQLQEVKAALEAAKFTNVKVVAETFVTAVKP
jgi:hypothetical protein